MSEINTPALLVIDAQVNMFDQAGPVYDAVGLITRLKTLIDRAYTAGVPVIYIQNNGPEGEVDEPGSPGWKILPALQPHLADIVIEKTTPDSFHQTPLQAELTARGVNSLVIAGLQTDWCVQATTRQAAALGYAVTLVRDCHSTFDSKTRTAREIIDEHNNQLEPVVNLKNAVEINF